MRIHGASSLYTTLPTRLGDTGTVRTVMWSPCARSTAVSWLAAASGVGDQGCHRAVPDREGIQLLVPRSLVLRLVTRMVTCQRELAPADPDEDSMALYDDRFTSQGAPYGPGPQEPRFDAHGGLNRLADTACLLIVHGVDERHPLGESSPLARGALQVEWRHPD